MMKPHRHSALIHAWADGAEIQVYSCGYWIDIEPTWNGCDEYRIKPEKEYPKSTLDYNDLCRIVNAAHKLQEETGDKQGYQTIIARLAADEAVKRYIKENEE
jgi:hypothetical protein